MKFTEISVGPLNRKSVPKLVALKCLMCVGEVVLSLFFEVMLEKRLRLYYVPYFQGHTRPGLEMVGV